MEMHAEMEGKTFLNNEELKALCMEAGADDVGFVEIERDELDARPS